MKKEAISNIAAALAALDVASSLSQLAQYNRYVRPVVDQSRSFKIEVVPTPVMWSVMQKGREDAFIANDCDLSIRNHRLLQLTGPNMAGKINVFAAERAHRNSGPDRITSVPARRAHIGVVDRLFSRVGAAR